MRPNTIAPFRVENSLCQDVAQLRIFPSLSGQTVRSPTAARRVRARGSLAPPARATAHTAPINR